MGEGPVRVAVDGATLDLGGVTATPSAQAPWCCGSRCNVSPPQAPISRTSEHRCEISAGQGFAMILRDAPHQSAAETQPCPGQARGRAGIAPRPPNRTSSHAVANAMSHSNDIATCRVTATNSRSYTRVPISDRRVHFWPLPIVTTWRMPMPRDMPVLSNREATGHRACRRLIGDRLTFYHSMPGGNNPVQLTDVMVTSGTRTSVSAPQPGCT